MLNLEMLSDGNESLVYISIAIGIALWILIFKGLGVI